MYNLSTSIASGFTTLAVYTSTTKTGTYSEITTSATRITLISTTQYYTYTYTGSDIKDNWYKFKLFNGSASASSFQTGAFKENTSDLTEDLRYIIEDTASTISSYRYTIKELRRMVKIACNTLQSTMYRNRFKADADGIISPSIGNMDKGIILMQAQIEIVRSQMIKQADTNISFSDGRGKFNNRSFDALKGIIKFLTVERNELISKYNRVAGNSTARMDMIPTSSGVST
jgi:hypothetical protein